MVMSRANTPAYPVPEPFAGVGLTKLELFAMAAMQGLLCRQGVSEHLAEQARIAAVLQMQELDKYEGL